jgi:hypothetical protein
MKQVQNCLVNCYDIQWPHNSPDDLQIYMDDYYTRVSLALVK